MPTIRIAGRTYVKNPSVDRFQVALSELENLRMCDIPPASHLEVLGIPLPDDAIESEVYALHSGDYLSEGSLEVYGGFASPQAPRSSKSSCCLPLSVAFHRPVCVALVHRQGRTSGSATRRRRGSSALLKHPQPSIQRTPPAHHLAALLLVPFTANLSVCVFASALLHPVTQHGRSAHSLHKTT